MGNAWNDEQDDFEDDGDGRANPNEPDWLKQLRRKVREQDKELKALREENQGFKTQTRAQALSELLQAKGVNPKAAKYFPSDIEPTPENLAKWLEEDGDLFAPAAQSTTDAAKPADEGAQTPAGGDAESTDEVPDWMQEFLKVQQTEQAGDVATPSNETQNQAALASAFKNAKNSTEFFSALQRGLT